MHRTRRELVAGAVPLAGLALVPNAWAARLLDKTPRIGPGTFKDSVASGDPTSDAVSFWSRITTDRPRSGARLIVAEDEGLSRVVAQTVVPTGRAMDHCLKARIGGLRPATTYYYAWQSGEEASPVGRTRTAPGAGSRAPVQIAVSSCQRFVDGFYTGLSHAAAQPDLDLVIFLGDYTYENMDAGTVPGRDNPTASVDLASYRETLRLNRTDVGLRELHRLHPTAHIWDDHEIADNYTDNMPEESPLQRAAGYRASFEWMPRMTFPEDRYRIYKPLPLGGVADVILLDERQYREGPGSQLPNDKTPRPFLGRSQLDFLKARLKSSPSTWKVVANQLPIFPIRGVEPLQEDQWQGHQAERDELLGFITDEGIKNVVFVTGDIHTYITSEVAKNFERLDLGLDQPVAVDYVAGSITSKGTDVPEQQVTSTSPHIKQFNGAVRGYGHLLLTGEQLVTEYRSGPVDRPGAPVRTIERFTQPAGMAKFTRQSNPPASASATRTAKLAARDAGALEAAKSTSLAAWRKKNVARAHAAKESR